MGRLVHPGWVAKGPSEAGDGLPEVLDQNHTDTQFFGVPAKKFLRFSTTTHSLIEQARYIAYSPARKSSFKQMANLTYYKNKNIHMMDYMPTSPAHLKVAIPKNAAFWSNYGPQLNQRFQAWLAS